LLDKKYRPKNYTEMIGNEEILSSLENITSNPDSLPSSILLTGLSGGGKTTLARIISSEIGSLDIQEKNISDQGNKEDAKKIIKTVKFKSLRGKYKVIILNECHRGNIHFWNAMLEILEEPPVGVLFILCTTEPERLPIAVKTRCMTFKVKSLTRKEIRNLVNKVVKKEKKKVDKEIVDKIAKSCIGSARVSLVLLGLVIDLKSKKDAIQNIENYEASESKEIKEFCYYLLQNQKPKFKEMIKYLSVLDIEPETARYAILGFLSSAMLKGWSQRKLKDISLMIDIFENSVMYSKQAGLVNACYCASFI